MMPFKRIKYDAVCVALGELESLIQMYNQCIGFGINQKTTATAATGPVRCFIQS